MFLFFDQNGYISGALQGGCQFETEQTKYAQLNESNAVNMNKWCN